MNRIKFKDFIYAYNFRQVLGNKDIEEDTIVIRIYLPSKEYEKDNWFEFGVYDFGRDETKWGICERALSKEVLESYIEEIRLIPELGTVSIYLTKDSKISYD